jgi:hypothetical protein
MSDIAGILAKIFGIAIAGTGAFEVVNYALNWM